MPRISNDKIMRCRARLMTRQTMTRWLRRRRAVGRSAVDSGVALRLIKRFWRAH